MEGGNGTAVSNLIDNLHWLSYAAGRRTLNALIPLLKVHISLDFFLSVFVDLLSGHTQGTNLKSFFFCV